MIDDDLVFVRPDVESWHERAACTRTDPDSHFGGPDGGTDEETRQYYNEAARRICMSCPVRRRCLREALTLDLQVGLQYGIWGGKDRRQRKALLKQRNLWREKQPAL